MAKTNRNKQKKWRKDAVVFNLVESVKEGRRVKHQGRLNKVNYNHGVAGSSALVGNMITRAAEHGNFTFCFTKKQLAEIAAQELKNNQPQTIEGESNEVV